MEYLPEPIRDFHDQKDLFKSMHLLYQDSEGEKNMPNWMQGQIYVVDWFLWFMAARGYTLQKTRKKNIEFFDWPNYRELIKKEQEASS